MKPVLVRRVHETFDHDLERRPIGTCDDLVDQRMLFFGRSDHENISTRDLSDKSIGPFFFGLYGGSGPATAADTAFGHRPEPEDLFDLDDELVETRAALAGRCFTLLRPATTAACNSATGTT